MLLFTKARSVTVNNAVKSESLTIASWVFDTLKRARTILYSCLTRGVHFERPSAEAAAPSQWACWRLRVSSGASPQFPCVRSCWPRAAPWRRHTSACLHPHLQQSVRIWVSKNRSWKGQRSRKWVCCTFFNEVAQRSHPSLLSGYDERRDAVGVGRIDWGPGSY